MELCLCCWEMAEDIYQEGEEFLHALREKTDREWDAFYQKFYMGEGFSQRFSQGKSFRKS